MPHLAITICATRSYTYAMHAQARHVVGCISTDKERWKEGTIILSGDDSSELREVLGFYQEILPDGWKVIHAKYRHKDGLINYEKDAQLLIARMRSSALDEARRLGAEICWSLDSDVMPPENALRCMADALAFDNGNVYQIAACPYSSQGGGDYLGGRGTPQRTILPDVYEDERIVPADFRHRKNRVSQRLKRERDSGRKEPTPELAEQRDALAKEFERLPATGDVFFRNSSTGIEPYQAALKKTLARALRRRPHLLKRVEQLVDLEAGRHKSRGFKRRGWVSSAYPGLGRGVIVPTDWHGFGCLLMGPRALALAQFDGYEGAGTEDLYIFWKRWHRAEMRTALILHAPCDHVIRVEDADKKTRGYLLCQAYFESNDPECVGHLRVERRPWIQGINGETR